MEQVPVKNKPYLIIGGGRLAKHIANYFQLLGIPFNQWKRTNKSKLEDLTTKSGKVLLAISDESIIPVAKRFTGRLVIHFSGVLSTKFAESAHPLFTFSNNLYPLKEYQNIPFITERNRMKFKDLFPELLNVSYEIDRTEKAKYHAWASMVGNFSSFLISEYKNVFTNLELPREILKPYLFRVVKNSMEENDALTGPIIRGDQKTIDSHLKSIETDFIPIYKSLVKCIKKRRK